MSYEIERLEKWARKLYEACNTRGAPWADISYRGAPVGEYWRAIARVAMKIHLECCEQRCAKCAQVFVHWCASCDRA